MATFNTNDTIRLVGTFTDWAPEGEVGDLMDPSTATVNILSSKDHDDVILTAPATRESLGVFYYDWITPTMAGDFIVEFVGMSNEATPKPIVSRQSISIRYLVE